MVAGLATGLADEISNDFDALLSPHTDWSDVLDAAPLGCVRELNELIVQLVLSSSAGFKRRIWDPVQRCERKRGRASGSSE